MGGSSAFFWINNRPIALACSIASLHLRIKAFFGTTETPVKTTAIATHVMIAIIKKRLNLDHALYKILPELDLNMFKTIPIPALLGKLQDEPETGQNPI